MNTTVKREKTFYDRAMRAGSVAAIIVLAVIVDSLPVSPEFYNLSALYGINACFWGIFLQAFPFITAGALISSAVQLFAGPDRLGNLLKSRGASFPVALASAVLLPACDCSSVTVAAGFAKKNYPLKSVLVYLLAAPIVNPIVIVSTVVAFPGAEEMALARVVMGVSVALVAAIFLDRLYGGDPGACASIHGISADQVCGHECACGHAHDHGAGRETGSYRERAREFILLGAQELLHVLPYVVFGALVSALFQTFIPRDFMNSIGARQGILLETAVMHCAAFLLSVCSTSDAFIAKGFSSHFGPGSLLGFMVFGPMIDVKNVIVLSHYFRKSFVAALFITTLALSLTASVAAAFLFK